MNDYVIQIFLIGLAGFLAQWGAWKLNIPAIVFLLLTGFALGPVLHIVEPRGLLGEMLEPAISVAVAVILFEASLNLNLKEIKPFRRQVRHMVLIGAPVSWGLGSLAAHFIAGLSVPVAVTFAGLLIVTGPTVIIPLLRSARLNARVTSTLKWEGIVNDPLGVLVAVLSFEYFSYVQAHRHADIWFYLYFSGVLAVVALCSMMIGTAAAAALERGRIPEYLKSYFLLILVIGLMTASNMLMEEAGLVAVTVFGITLANRGVSSLNDIKRFKEGVTLLFVSGVFILLTADLDPAVLLEIDLRGILFIAVLIALVRPVAALASGIGTKMTLKERLLVGWIAPRGIVCAAMAGVMGPMLTEAGFEDGTKLLPLAFAIVVITVILHSLTAKPLAKKFGLAATEGEGLIIVGSYPWTLQLAEILKEKKIPVLIADTDWHKLKPARLANVPVFYGEILSEEAEFAIDHSGFGALLAATENAAYNALVCNAYAADFGRERVWQLATPEEDGPERKKLSHTLNGKVFAAKDLVYDRMWERYWEGHRFRASRVGAGGADILGGDAEDTKIGVIRADGRLQLRSPDIDPPAKEGDTVLWLGRPRGG